MQDLGVVVREGSRDCRAVGGLPWWGHSNSLRVSAGFSPTVLGFPVCCGAEWGEVVIEQHSQIPALMGPLSILGPIQAPRSASSQLPWEIWLPIWMAGTPHSLLWGDWGILGTFRCLSALFWSYHRRSLCSAPHPGDLGRPLKPPPLIADVAPQPGDTVPSRGHWSVVTGRPPESCGWVGPGGPPRSASVHV